MTDTFSKAKRRVIMSRIRATDTGPERAVEASLIGLGLRFHKHDKKLPGRPDFVLPRKKTVLFVHGCFWHQHGCSRSVIPKSNSGYWKPKLLHNIRRFSAVRRQLNRLGWRVRVAWECQINHCSNLGDSLAPRLGRRIKP